MLIRAASPSPVQPADLVIRPKSSGFGFHYGTGVSGGYVAHTTPELGKHIGNLDEFGNGKPVRIVRQPRSPVERFIVEKVAVSDVGTKPYDPLTANCEHDAMKAQAGIAQSPTVNGLAFIGGAVLLGAIIKSLAD